MSAAWKDEPCECDPKAPRDERCSKDWARCAARMRHFIEEKLRARHRSARVAEMRPWLAKVAR